MPWWLRRGIALELQTQANTLSAIVARFRF